MSNKPRVTHVITGLETGGAEMMLLKLVQNSVQSFEHTVVSLSGLGALGPLIQQAGSTVVPINLKLPFNGVSNLLRKVHLSKPDVLQGWMYHGNLAATFAHLTERAALSWSIRCSYIGGTKEKWLTRGVAKFSARLSNRPATIIYNATRSRMEHAAHGYADGRAVVIPNGFDIDRFRPSAALRASMRKKWRLGADAVAVGVLARVHPMKDHVTLLRAAAKATQRNSSIVFIVAGRGVPDLRHAMPDLVAGLEPHLRLLPEEEDTPGFMNGLDIFALSSAWGEAFPNVLGEAMACAIPCVATDVGDSAEIVADAGRIVGPQAPEALAHAILELAAAGPDARRAMGSRARARIAANFALDGVAERYARVWLDLAGRASASERNAS